MDSWAQDLLPGRDEQLTSVTVDITALLHCIKVVSTISSHHSEHVHFITLLKLQRWQPWAGVYTKQSGKKQNAKRLVWLHFGLKATAVIISEQNKPIYRANSWSSFATGGKRFLESVYLHSMAGHMSDRSPNNFNMFVSYQENWITYTIVICI